MICKCTVVHRWNLCYRLRSSRCTPSLDRSFFLSKNALVRRRMCLCTLPTAGCRNVSFATTIWIDNAAIVLQERRGLPNQMLATLSTLLFVPTSRFLNVIISDVSMNCTYYQLSQQPTTFLTHLSVTTFVYFPGAVVSEAHMGSHTIIVAPSK